MGPSASLSGKKPSGGGGGATRAVPYAAESEEATAPRALGEEPNISFASPRYLKLNFAYDLGNPLL